MKDFFSILKRVIKTIMETEKVVINVKGKSNLRISLHSQYNANLILHNHGSMV